MDVSSKSNKSAYNIDNCSAEDDELLKNCQSNSYRVANKLIKFFMNFCTIRIMRRRIVRNNHRTPQYESLLISNKYSKSRFVRIVNYIYTIVISYIVIKFIAISLIDFQYKRILDKWNPRLRENATRFENCVLKNDIIVSPEDEKLIEKLSAIRGILDFIGNYLSILYGFKSAIALIIASIAISFYISNKVYLYSNKPNVDCLVFLLWPLEHKQKVKRELSCVIEGLIANMTAFRVNSMNSNNWISPKVNLAQWRESVLKSISDSDSYIRLLRNIEAFNLVKPKVWGPKMHRIFVSFCAAFLIAGLVVGTISVLIFNSILVGLEMSVRVENRLSVMKCRAWNENGTLFRDTGGLEELNEVSKLEYYHSSKLDTWKSFIGLLVIELQNRFTWIGSLIYLEFLFVCFNLSFWIAVHAIIYFLDHILEAVWASQLQSEIRHCIGIILRAQEMKAPDHKREDADKEVCKTLTIAFLSYQLFRRHHKTHRKFLNVIFFRSAAVALQSMAVCYLTGKNLDAKYNFFLLNEAMTMAFILNMYLISGSLVTGKIKKLMRLVYRLIALSNLQSLQRTPIIDLWRRHLMSDAEIKCMHAPNFFGIYITFSTVVTINAYLFILWIMALNGSTEPTRYIRL